MPLPVQKWPASPTSASPPRTGRLSCGPLCCSLTCPGRGEVFYDLGLTTAQLPAGRSWTPWPPTRDLSRAPGTTPGVAGREGASPIVLSDWIVPAGSTVLTPAPSPGTAVAGRCGTVAPGSTLVWAKASELVSISAVVTAIVRIFIEHPPLIDQGGQTSVSRVGFVGGVQKGNRPQLWAGGAEAVVSGVVP